GGGGGGGRGGAARGGRRRTGDDGHDLDRAGGCRDPPAPGRIAPGPGTGPRHCSRMSMRDDRVDAVFAALADPTRRRLLDKLAVQPSATAPELAAAEPVRRQAIVKHPRPLDEARLVIPSRTGSEGRYAITPEPLEDAVGC